MTKTEIKNFLYKQFIEQLYEKNGLKPIEPGTTIKINWTTYLNITKQGAKYLKKELKEFFEVGY